MDCNGEAALVKKKIKIKKKCTAEQFLFPFVDTFEKYLAIRLVAEAQVRNSRRCSMFTLVENQRCPPPSNVFISSKTLTVRLVVSFFFSFQSFC